MRSIFFAVRASVFAVLVVAFAPRAHAQSGSEHWFEIARALAPAATHATPAGTGTLLDFTPHATQPGLSFDIQPPEPNCSACHDVASGDPATSPQFRPFSSWMGSMMANATRDPLFFAALDIANHDMPGSGDYCLRCHTPRGWLEGQVVKSGYGGPLNDVTQGAAACLLGGTYDEPDDNNNDMGGVTCHFCHRMMPNGPNGEPVFTDNGNAWVDDVACTNPNGSGPGPCRRGPYAYTDGTAPPPHEWEYSEYHTESTMCGNCHNVTSPDLETFAAERIFANGLDGAVRMLKLNDGTETGHPFPIERTFSEWQQSEYAQESPQTTCQSCHMPESEDPDATACSLRVNNRTGNLPVHAFVGGNTWVPGIIEGEYGTGLDSTENCAGSPPSLPGSCRTLSLEQTIGWARDNLGTAATLDTTITSYTPPTGSAAGSLDAQVLVTNLTGHKLPTGYAEGRRMWLNVQVHDNGGNLIFESAAYDPTTAVLTEDEQAHVYETLQGIFNYNGANACDVVDGGGAPMFHFILNDCIARDTRIPPLGFVPATPGDPNGYDLRPVGITYPETSPGSGVLVNYDTAMYSVTVPAGTIGPLTATARLYYQTASNDYMAFLRNEATTNNFPAENDLCSGAPSRPFTVGPQDRSRGEYAFELWNNASDDTQQPGYGKSPPELMQTSSASTP